MFFSGMAHSYDAMFSICMTRLMQLLHEMVTMVTLASDGWLNLSNVDWYWVIISANLVTKIMLSA